MRKIAKIIVFILAAAMIFSLSACSVSDNLDTGGLVSNDLDTDGLVNDDLDTDDEIIIDDIITYENVIKNGFFINRNIANLPSNWEIYSPDPENMITNVYPTDSSNALLNTSSYLSIRLANMSYVRVSQTIKVRPNTVYCFSYKVQLRSYVYFSDDKNVGIYPLILEDKTMSKSPNYVYDVINTNKLYWTSDSYKFYFNSGNNNSLSIALCLGAEDACCSGTIYLTDISVRADMLGMIDESRIYTVKANKDYL